MTHYKVTVRRDGEIVSSILRWATSDREQARIALERESRKLYGDNIEVEIH